MKEHIRKYLDYQKQQLNRSPWTIKSYGYVLNIFSDYFADVDIKDIDEKQLQSFFGWLTEIKRISNTSKRTYRFIINSFFKYLHLKQVIEKNPISHIPMFKVERRVVPYLMEEEVFKILKMAYSKTSRKNGIHKLAASRNFVIFVLCYYLGLRISEILRLEMRSVNLGDNPPSIRIIGKGNKERILPLHQKALASLKMWFNLRPNNEDNPILFCGLYKWQGVSVRRIQKYLSGIVKEAEIEKNVTPHILRHSFASHLLQKGTDIRTIQQLLGHSSLTSTQVYLHIPQTKLYNEVSKL